MELLHLIKHWLHYIDGKERINLASQISTMSIWTKVEKWSELFHFISGKKVDEKKKISLGFIITNLK